MYFDIKSGACFLTFFSTIKGFRDIHEILPKLGQGLDPQLDPKFSKPQVKLC